MATTLESGRVLDPVERLSEILFGLIMAMTFTGSIHAASDGREEIHTVLFGAIGCNIAWGIVDAVMYVLTDLIEHNRGLEYRMVLTRDGLLGAVLFYNVTATTLPDVQTFGEGNHGIGLGLRLKFNKHSNTNLALDHGWGEGHSSGWFMGMTEVF